MPARWCAWQARPWRFCRRRTGRSKSFACSPRSAPATRLPSRLYKAASHRHDRPVKFYALGITLRMVTHDATRSISGLARALAQQGMMTEQDAENLQSQAQIAGVTFVEQLLANKRFSAAQIAM